MAYIHKDEQIMKYIPKKLHAAILSANGGDDGYWIELNSGWTGKLKYSDRRLMHFWTIRELKIGVRTIHKEEKL